MSLSPSAMLMVVTKTVYQGALVDQLDATKGEIACILLSCIY